jgi:hypothetical protein
MYSNMVLCKWFLNLLPGGFPYVSDVLFYFRVTVVKLFRNETGYISVFMCCLIYYFFQFCFFYLHVCCIASCIGCHVFWLLHGGCSHSVVPFVLTTA